MIKTVNDVIDALGGLPAVAKLSGATYRAAWNWKKARKFPARTYVAFTRALADQGLSAPPSLWGMHE